MKKIVHIKGKKPAELVWISSDRKVYRVRWTNLQRRYGDEPFSEKDIPAHLVRRVEKVPTTPLEKFFINLFKKKKK